MRVCASVCINFASSAVVLDIFPLSSPGRDETSAEAGGSSAPTKVGLIGIEFVSRIRGSPAAVCARKLEKRLAKTRNHRDHAAASNYGKITPSLIRFNESVAPSENSRSIVRRYQ